MKNHEMDCSISLALSIFLYASSQDSLKFPSNLCFLYDKDSNWYPSQKDLAPNFLDYRDDDKGLHLMSVHMTIPMGRALLGLNSSFKTLLLEDRPSHPDKKKYYHYLLHSTGWSKLP